jgi:hypothetical protein
MNSPGDGRLRPAALDAADLMARTAHCRTVAGVFHHISGGVIFLNGIGGNPVIRTAGRAFQ